MVSLPHEWGTDVFRERLARTLLPKSLAKRIPKEVRAEVTDASAISKNPHDRRADLVILFRAPNNLVVYALIVEIQLRPDDDKPFRWPEYLGVIRERHRCPTDVLVVCITGAVARWAATPIVLGHSGSVVHPIVLTPDMFPKITDEATAIRLPTLAALSALLVGPARTHWENWMVQTEGYVYLSDFARGHFSQGKAEGMAEGEAHALLRLLEKRHRTHGGGTRARQRLHRLGDPRYVVRPGDHR